MRQLSIGLLFAVLCPAPVFAAQTATTQPVQLTTEPPIVSDDNCLVQRFTIDLPKGTPDGFITLQLGGKDGGGCKYPSAKDQPQTVTVIVTAMVGRGQCMFHMDIATLHAFQAFDVPKNAKLKDIVHLDAQAGTPALEEGVRLGDYHGDPLIITVSPKAYLKANPQRP